MCCLGGSRNEYLLKYNPYLFSLDYTIDIDRRLEGKSVCGMKISKVKEVYFGEKNIGHCTSL